MSNANWESNEVSMPYEYGYLYYQDPNYLPMVRNADLSLNLTVHAGAPSLFLLPVPTSAAVVTASSFSGLGGTATGPQIFTWLQTNGFFRETFGTEGDPVAITPAMTTALNTKYPAQAAAILNGLEMALANAATPAVQNDNFFVDGDGVLRLAALPDAGGVNQVLVEYASNLKSHGQPEGMSIDVFGLGGLLISLPGDVFPYNLPIDPAWYWTTLASNTLVVDQGPQIWSSTYNKNRDAVPEANQVTYGFASTMAIQKVSSTTLYPGVTEDRAVFMTPGYVADVFAGFSAAPHIYDLPWHPTGTLTTAVPLTVRSTSDFTDAGYDSLTNVMHADVDQSWSATLTLPNGKAATFLAAANPGTELITADGYLYVYGDNNQINPPVFFERQDGVNNAIFTNAIDLSGGTYLSEIDQEPLSSSSGNAGLLVHLAHGSVADSCFTAFGPGVFSSTDGTFASDAWQALVVRNEQGGVQGMYLGGGTTLSTERGSLTRVDSTTPGGPGLAYVEQVTDGGWSVGNLSPTPATITVSLPCQGVDATLTLAASTVQPL